MAVYIVSVLLALLIGWDLAKPLNNHPVAFYAGAFVLDAFVVACGLLGWGNPLLDFICGIVGTGSLAFFMFCIVMFTGCFKLASKPRMRLKQVRQPLALTSCILACGHIAYSRAVFGPLMDTLGIAFIAVSLLLALLLAILGVTSIVKVQDSLGEGKLDAIHKLSYVFFGILCVHAAWFHAVSADWLIAAMYVVIGVVYAVLRLRAQRNFR